MMTKKKAKKKVVLRKVTPLPDVPDGYLVEQEVHGAPPPPFDEPLPTEPLEIDNQVLADIPADKKSGWWRWLFGG